MELAQMNKFWVFVCFENVAAAACYTHLLNGTNLMVPCGFHLMILSLISSVREFKANTKIEIVEWV